MRLFRVEGEWTGPDLRHHLAVQKGEQGPGLYMRDAVIPLVGPLAEPFRKLPFTELGLRAGLVNNQSPLTISPATRNEVSRIRSGQYYGKCAVHVCLPQREGCKVCICSSVFGEKLTEGRHPRVVREYLPLHDSEGVKVLATSEDNEEMLVELTPGATFRICRQGRLVRGEAPVLVVTWSGHNLRVMRPARYRDWRAQEGAA